MGQEPRKATEVLLDLESKVGMLLDIIRAQDLNIKILSNKLNDVIGRLDKQQAAPPKIVVETVQTTPSTVSQFPALPAGDPERTVPILAEAKLPETSAPHGFRRSSRPETYAGDNAYLPDKQEFKMPMQMPKAPPGRSPMSPPPGRSEAIVTPTTKVGNQKQVSLPPPQQEEVAEMPPTVGMAGQIPVMQRCVDKNGKSVFMANVEITDLDTSQPVFKTRTNGTGKWMAPLGIGTYRVTIQKRESLSKEKIEATQDIQIDGSQSKVELPMLIIK